jgi:hypothetical protein
VLGFVWDQCLDVAAKDASRSVNRGLGPARQSAEIDITLLAPLASESVPLVVGGPINPATQFILGAFFLMREIELSCALFGSVKLRGEGPSLVVSWLLPESKTDSGGSSVSRSWGCLCSSGPICPAHLAEKQIKVMELRFGKSIEGLPFFPDLLGKFVPKERVVKTYEQLAVRLGEPLVDDMGRNRFGGHSARVSGARYLANIGLELFKLAVLARWASPVLLRYVGEAPLTSITADCKRLLAGHQLHDVLRDVVSRSLSDSLCLPDLRQEINEMIESNATVSQVAAAILPNLFMMNVSTQVVHRVHDPVLSGTPEIVSLCGWTCGRARCKLFKLFPEAEAVSRLCDKRACFGAS